MSRIVELAILEHSPSVQIQVFSDLRLVVVVIGVSRLKWPSDALFVVGQPQAFSGAHLPLEARIDDINLPCPAPFNAKEPGCRYSIAGVRWLPTASKWLPNSPSQ